MLIERLFDVNCSFRKAENNKKMPGMAHKNMHRIVKIENKNIFTEESLDGFVATVEYNLK